MSLEILDKWGAELNLYVEAPVLYYISTFTWVGGTDHFWICDIANIELPPDFV